MLSLLATFAKYTKGKLNNHTNLTLLKSCIRFIEKQFFNTKLQRTYLQNFLRQSTVVDIIMRTVVKFGETKFDYKEREKIKPFFLRLIKILNMFIYKNNVSASYLYQWKNLFSDILSEKVSYSEE